MGRTHRKNGRRKNYMQNFCLETGPLEILRHKWESYIILKQFFLITDLRLWTEFIWLLTKSSGRFGEYSNEPTASIKGM
jgi:hypothetical protein